MGRAGKRTRVEIPRHRRNVLRRNAARYLVLALFWCVLAVPTVWVEQPVMRGFLLGVFVASYVALVAYSLTLDGSHLRLMGAEAEQWTSKELRQAKGWKVFDRIEFADRDIDHVAVGPRQVLAVETKWTSRSVKITERGVDGLGCDGIHHAERAAERIRNFLASKGVNEEVIPVLVLWGPQVPRLADGYQRVGDVRVLIGSQAKEWREKLAKLPQWSRSTQAVLPALEEYVERFEQRRTPTNEAMLRRLLPGS